MKFGIGQAVTRREDDRLLTGTGQFVDDLDLPGAAHAVFVRSVDAHGRLLGVDTNAARAVPGVLAVLRDRADVAWRLVPQDRCIRGERLAERDRGRHGLDVGEDLRGCVVRRAARFGNDRRHRLADEAHRIGRQGVERRTAHGFARRVLERGIAGERRDVVDEQVGAGQYGEDARHGTRGSRSAAGGARRRRRSGSPGAR